MEYALLGPLEVRTNEGNLVLINRLKQRQLLAALLIRPNQIVTIDQLALDLWDDWPPTSIRSNIKTYVAGLRSLLSPSSPAEAPIQTYAGGYRINVEPHELDTAEFNRLIELTRRNVTNGNLSDADRSFGKSLDLWRGKALEGIPLTETLSVAATKLTETRLDVLAEWADVRLALGDHNGLIERLRDGIREDPYREGLYARLMRVLNRQGRPGQALTVYDDLRKLLANELGADPGQQLQGLYQQILVSDPDLDSAPTAPVIAIGRVAPVPRQLPINVPVLLGRDAETTKIEYTIASGTQTGAPPVVTISGTPGVGKSALAVHAAHVVRESFPDGQLYVNLYGATPGVAPLRSHEILARFLKVLGVPAGDVPNDTHEAAALFRSLLADRKILVVLDDAATVDQIRPLLPSGPGCAALITSRNRMTTLQHAVHIDLATLAPNDAVAMLKHLAGGRIDTDLYASQRLAALVGHLPLGLHIAAARLKARPDWTVQQLIERLNDEHGRLRELQADDITIAGSISVSYFALRNSTDLNERAAADAFRLLGSLNTPSFTPPVIAALLDLPVPDADPITERLVTSHLIESPTPGRFTMHDLVRLCAQERAAVELTPAQREGALQSVLAFYLVTAKDAVYLMDPHREQFPIPDLDAEPLTFADGQDARHWLEDERTNMVALILQAFDGPDEACLLGLSLARVLHWFFLHGAHAIDSRKVNESAVEIGRRLGDSYAEAYAIGHLSTAHWQLGNYEDAVSMMQLERQLCRELGDQFGEQRALANLGSVYLRIGQPESAIKCNSLQLEIARRIRSTVGERYALMELGAAHLQCGRLELAHQLLSEAHASAKKDGDTVHLSWILSDLAKVDEESRQFLAMKYRLQEAIKTIQQSPDRDEEPDMYIGLARAHRLLGERSQAIETAELALHKIRTFAHRPFEAEALEEYHASLAMPRSRMESDPSS